MLLSQSPCPSDKNSNSIRETKNAIIPKVMIVKRSMKQGSLVSCPCLLEG